MRYLLSLLCFAIITSAFADTIGNVEFHLPESPHGWEIGNKLENEKGTTLIYIPNDSSFKNSKEFFGVNANILSTNINDVSYLEKSLSQMFPNMLIDLWVLEINHNSILYEWAAKDHGQEKIHGLGRAFSTKEGTVGLAYHSENMQEIGKARAIWLPILKEAKIK